MAAHGRSGHERARTRALFVGLALAALVTGACSGTTRAPAATRRGGTTTSTSIVVESKVIGGGQVLDNGTTTFDVEGGTVKVLVPVGAVTKGSEVQVREVTGAPSDLGAVQRGGKVYDLTIKNGKIQPNKQISLQFEIAQALPASDPRPIGGYWDESASVWRAVNSDYPSVETVTVFAFKPGKYSWLHWSWDKAVQAGTDTIRMVVGPQTPSESALKCESTDAVRSRFDLTTNTGNALAWCAGRDNGDDVVRVRNNGQSPLALRSKGFGTPRSSNENPLFMELSAALAAVWSPQDGERVKIVEPGTEVVFPLADANTKGLLRAELNGFTQHYDVLSAAVAFTAGFHSGNASVAASVLAQEPAVREALVTQLTSPGCVKGLGDQVTGGSYTTDKLAAYASLLVLKCVDPDTAGMVMKAANRNALGTLRSSFTGAVPTQTEQLIDPAMRNALSPLVEPAGGPVAGEIIVSPKGTSGGDSALPPVGTAPAATVAVTTTAPGTVTATTGPPAPTAATTVPATTPPTTPPTTPTTPTTPPPPPATTTTTAPLGPLVFDDIKPSPCGMTGGTLRASGSNFRPGGAWSATFFSPNNARVSGSGGGGNANANGTIEWTFNCATAPEPGSYRVEIAENCSSGTPAALCRPSVIKSFFVNTYDTRWVPDTKIDRAELAVCSGFGEGTPPGVLRQTFMAFGGAEGSKPTISQIGIVNIEEFTGEVAILQDGKTLFSVVVAVPTPTLSDVVVPVVLSGLEVKPGQTPILTLQLTVTKATAGAPNKAINFARSTSDAAAGSGIAVTTSNTCPWLTSRSSAPPPGTDLIGWIVP